MPGSSEHIPLVPITPSILDADFSAPLIISLVGGGGKTSTAFWLAQEFKKRGHCVLVSTTTKMYLPAPEQADYFICADNNNSEEKPETTLLSRLQNQVSEPAITFCFQNEVEPNNGKMTGNTKEQIKVSGITPNLVKQLKSTSPFTVFIIEADGAKCLPIKAPSGHEPCIPINSDMVIGVTGAEIIHTQACPERIHRWNTFSALTQCSEGDEIDHRILCRLIEHPHGMFKQAPDHAVKIWLINKVDLAPSYLKLTQLAQTIITRPYQLDAIWLAAMHDLSPIKDIVTRRNS
ncbi:selenium cofactor biosynthesis protein YqeC [Pseudomonadota bacterium]